MDKQEIIDGMKLIMHTALYYCHPSEPDIDDWHTVYMIADTIYRRLTDEQKRSKGIS